MIKQFLHGFIRNSRGSLMFEVAIAIPILLTLAVGGLEISRYVLLNQKLDRAAATMSDLVSQASQLSVGDLGNLFNAAEHVMSPFGLGASGIVVISSVSAENGTPPIVKWQESGAGSMSVSSQVGSAGGAANLPSGFEVRDGENVIIAEVFYTYEPWILGGVTSGGQLYHRAFNRPRLNPLIQLN